MKIPTILFICCFFISCQSTKKENALITLQSIPVPTHESGEGNLFTSNDGETFLSLVEYINDTTDALFFSKLENGQWVQPTEIAQGSNWFVNWADFPSLTVNGDWMAAHWLQKSADGTYDYDVRISQSTNNGRTWQPSFIPHRDSLSAEHGFVTMMPISDDRMFAVWLDGRNTKQEGDDSGQSADGHGHGHGAMTLRTAEFDRAGNLYEEAELDNRICDCCQTDVAMTPNGPVVVYRDRSEHEIRDISIVRKVDGKWTAPHLIHADNWEITGCPVNGPAIAATGDQVAVAWFTSANKKSKVQVAFSNDAGAVFSTPISIDDGSPLGRVDIEMMGDKSAVVTWLESVGDSAEIKLATVFPKNEKVEKHTLIATSAARSSGFPVLTKNKNGLMLAWTEVDSATVVRTGYLMTKD